jgi:hypothetical protein
LRQCGLRPEVWRFVEHDDRGDVWEHLGWLSPSPTQQETKPKVHQVIVPDDEIGENSRGDEP